MASTADYSCPAGPHHSRAHTRFDMSQIHHAVMVGTPDCMARVASFEVWWDSLAINGS